jgi:hypothetical protein
MVNSKTKEKSMELEVEYKKGLTWRVLLGGLYAILIFMPANIFMMLLTNQTVGVGYATLVLFTGIAAIYGTKLSRQETWLLLAMTGGVQHTVALSLLQTFYSTRLCPEVWRFRTPDTGLPLPYATPDWVAPPSYSETLVLRTFLHTDWVIPITIMALSTIFSVLADIALGLLMYQLYAVEEKLPFPLQHVQAEAVITLSERDPKRMTVLYITAFIGLIYGIFLYFFPFALGLAAVAPIPFVDFTPLAEWYIPGTIFGIATDIWNFLLPFILPFHIVLNIALASIAIYVVGNALLVHLYPQAPAGLFGWVPQMPSSRIVMWSQIYVWFGPIIGMSIIAALYPLFRNPRRLIRTMTGLSAVSKIARGKGIIDSKYLLIMYFAGTLAHVALAAWLVPRAPIWIFLFLSVLWPFLNALILTRAVAETALAITVPYVREAIYLTSCPGTDIWFAPISGASGFGWAQNFKVCELTQTRFTNFILAVILATLIGTIVSFVYTELLWKTSPIPEGWRAAAMFWPLSATTQALWITRSFQFVRIDWILAGAGVGIALAMLGDFLHLPISLISIVAGMWTWPHYAISYLIGAFIYKFLEIRIGKGWLMENRAILVAGFGIGSGIAATFAAFWGLTTKSMFVLPF